MNQFCVSTLLVVLMNSAVLSDERYRNTQYGIELIATNGWRVIESAKLRVPLKQLSDDQLTELLKAYDDRRIVTVKKEFGDSVAMVEVRFHEHQSASGRSALGIARTCEKSFQANVFRITVASHVTPICGKEAGAFSVARASGSNSAPDTELTLYYIPRSRTFVELKVVVPQNANEPLREDVMSMLNRISIDVNADQMMFKD